MGKKYGHEELEILSIVFQNFRLRDNTEVQCTIEHLVEMKYPAMESFMSSFIDGFNC